MVSRWLLDEAVHAVVLHFHRHHDGERVVDEHEGRFVLLEFGFKPVQLFFAQRAGAGIEVGDVPLSQVYAEKIIEVDEFAAFVLEAVIWLQSQLAPEQLVPHLARDSLTPVVVIAESDMHRHLESVGDGLGVVDACLVLEVEIVVGRRIVVEVVADQKDLLDAGWSELMRSRAEISRSSVLNIDSVSSGLLSGPL